MTINRRKFMWGAVAAGGAVGAASGGGLRGFPALAVEPVRLGSILDISGAFDAYGKPMDMALRLAIEEINAGGGLNGSPVETISYDTQSNMALYTQYAQQLVRKDKVDAVHGGILSASREAIRQTLHRANTLYFYNVLYEGGVCDRNIFITGVTPAQQVVTLIPAAVKKWGKKIYVLAADYNYGQITARWVKKYADTAGGVVVQTDFFPLDVSDFGSTITKIQQAAPDMIVTVLVGGAHLSFYRQWAASGMNKKIPMASTTLGTGNEHKVLTKEEGDGIMVAYNYSLELPTPENKSFIERWTKKYGDTKALHEIAVSQYQGLHLWAEGVRKAKSRDHDAVIKALEGGLSITGPTGKVAIDPMTHHAILNVHLIEIRDQKMNIISSTNDRQPLDTQGVCDLKKNPEDNMQYEIKI